MKEGSSSIKLSGLVPLCDALIKCKNCVQVAKFRFAMSLTECVFRFGGLVRPSVRPPLPLIAGLQRCRKE